MKEFSPTTIKALKNYVYVYSDPDTHKPFYVGKGKGNRAFQHLLDVSENDKVKKIREIRDRGKDPVIEILAHGLNEETAFKVEAAAIDLVGIDNLTNTQRGHESSFYGKIEVSQLNARYNRKELSEKDFHENIILIRINKLYHNDMTALQLYEATRGHWRLNVEQAQKMKYVAAVYDGMIIEVYKVTEWLHAFSTFMERTEHEDIKQQDKSRYEFVGTIAPENIRKKYVDKSVTGLFKHGEANPIKYVWGKRK